MACSSCTPRNDENDNKKTNNYTWIIPLVFVIILIIVFAFIYKKDNRIEIGQYRTKARPSR